MNIRKCDGEGCGKILTKDDDYFTIDEIQFNKGDHKKPYVRLTVDKEGKDTAYDMSESWCSYRDLHFCVDCFKKENLYKYINRMEIEDATQ